MSKSINRVTLVGNLGADGEIRATQSGGTIVKLSVATNESWKDKDGQPQERCEWHSVKVFGKLGEVIASLAPTKGRQVYVEGSIRSDRYQDSEGNEKLSFEIVADTVLLLGSAPAQDDAGDAPAAPAPAASGKQGYGRRAA